MQRHIAQSKHNHEFLCCIKDKFPDKFYDWKITSTFYIAIHYVRALSKKRGITIGNSHESLKNAIDPKPPMPPILVLSPECLSAYKTLYRYCRTARYDGFLNEENFNRICKINYENYCAPALEVVKTYIETQSIVLS